MKLSSPGPVSILWAVATLAVVYLFWPPPIVPLRFFPDTWEYWTWPKPLVHSGVLLMGARPVGYPIVLQALGVDAALSHFQTWLSVASWGLLGWTMAKGPGALLALLLAYGSAVRSWNVVALTESLTLSLTALLIALATMLARRWDWRLMAAWLVAACWFALLRDSNIVVLPFLGLPLISCGARRFVVAVACVSIIVAGALFDASTQVRWRAGLRTAIEARIVWSPNAADRDLFRAHGMPAQPLGKEKKEFLEWVASEARPVYTRWFLKQPSSYLRPWDYLFLGGRPFARPDTDLVDHLNERFFPELQPYRGTLTAWADRLFRWLGLPLAIAVFFLFAPAAEWLARGAVSTPALWAASLTGALLAHGFLAYNLSGVDHPRHLLLSAVLYRLVPIYVVLTLIGARRDPRRT